MTPTQGAKARPFFATPSLTERGRAAIFCGGRPVTWSRPLLIAQVVRDPRQTMGSRPRQAEAGEPGICWQARLLPGQSLLPQRTYLADEEGRSLTADECTPLPRLPEAISQRGAGGAQSSFPVPAATEPCDPVQKARRCDVEVISSSDREGQRDL